MTARQNKVIRKFRHKIGSGENSLKYFQSCTKKDEYVVMHYMHAGQQDFPNVYRCGSIEEARKVWAEIQDSLIRRGYEIVDTKSLVVEV